MPQQPQPHYPYSQAELIEQGKARRAFTGAQPTQPMPDQTLFDMPLPSLSWKPPRQPDRLDRFLETLRQRRQSLRDVRLQELAAP